MTLACTSFSIALIVSLFISFSTFSQNYFSGTATYQIEYYDTINEKFVTTPSTSVIIMDSLYVRSENESKLGVQVLVKDIEQDTARLMMTALGTDYAIFIDYNAKSDEETTPYTYKKGTKKQSIAGYEAQQYTYILDQQEYDVFVTTDIDGRYSSVHNELEGFPLQYTMDFKNMTVRYTCIGISNTSPKAELFKIPKSYKKVTLEEFYENIQSQN